MSSTVLLRAASPFLLATLAAAQDWPTWRGPTFDGASPATGLPERFSREENVRWRVEIPGKGASTPVVVGTHVFLTTAIEADGLLLVQCYDRDTGELHWEEAAGSGYRAGGRGSATGHDERSNYASPSAVSDGERVAFLFGNGDLSVHDVEGERLWARNLQEDFGDFAYMWTYGASPTLWKGRLYLPVLQRDQPTDGSPAEKPIESFLLALDLATGETVFRHVRPAPARMESLESYATAIPCTTPKGREELLVLGGDVITGHDPDSGAELWRWGTWNEGHREQWWRIVPSPVVGAGHVLVCAPKRAPAYAIGLDGTGVLEASALRWRSEGRENVVSSDVPTPLFMDGSFFVLSDVRRALSRVDPASGEIAWSLELPDRAPWEASPTGAEGKIYCISHSGTTLVVDAADGRILHQVDMAGGEGDRIRSSIAIASGALFLRTDRELLCLARATD
jgi:outer membrane protein assembly factor BamB